MKLDFKVVIIGSGVAGMTAALYLKRASVDCCILEKEMPGGQINRTSTIENYPGIIHITGPELAEEMFNQVKNLGVTYQYGDVTNIEDHGDYKTIITKTGKLNCQYVIIATGRSPRKLNLPNEDRLMNRGISWCAVCDGPLYKGKKVVVIGGGNSAVEEAIYLSNICSEVTVIHRSDTFTAQKHLIERLQAKENVTILFHHISQEFVEEDQKLHAVIVKDNHTSEVRKIECDGCFIYIGQTPNTQFLEKMGVLNEQGYVVTDEKQETNIKNIFACGDVTMKELYQIVTATNDGAIAATTIVNRK